MVVYIILSLHFIFRKFSVVPAVRDIWISAFGFAHTYVIIIDRKTGRCIDFVDYFQYYNYINIKILFQYIIFSIRPHMSYWLLYTYWTHHISTGTPISRLPIMAKRVLDLYTLYKLVVQRGGIVAVITKKLWQEIIRGLGLPPSITSAAFTLRTQ